MGDGRRCRILLVAVLVFGSLGAFAAEESSIPAVVFPTAPVIDGVLDDEVWETAATVEGFIQFQPEFGAPSPFRTVVLVGYTSEALYVAFRCFDSDPGRIAAAVTSRDGNLRDDDSVTVLLDTNLDRRTAYYFATNSLGVQLDGKVANNGRTVDDKWDATWISASARTSEGWTAEFEIPFRMLRFESGEDVSWGVNFRRRVPRRLETSLWSGPGESIWRVSEFEVLTSLDVRSQGLKKFAVIPYGLVVAEKDRGVDTKFGGDIRFRISSELSADITVNPDFALIEADVEEINLSRFEHFVPEKRPFFLEGIEMYSQRIRQFYSRRIGDITAGGKMVGGLGGFDLAVLASRADLYSEEVDGTVSSTAADYTVLRVQRGVFGPSTIGLLAANRRVEGENVGSIGADMTLFFTDTLGMTGQLVRSHGPTNDGTLGWFLRPAFDSANSHFHVRYTSLDAGLQENMNVIGFLRDDDRREWDANIEHTFWFNKGVFEKIKGDVNYNRYTGQEGVLRSEETNAEFRFVFSSRWEVELEYVDEFRLEEIEFDNSIASVKVGYDNRAGRSIFVSYGTGTNFGSDLKLAAFELQYRLSKAWELSYELTWLELDPDPEMESTWIHVLRSSYYFTNDLFVSLFVQTNSVISKENVQLLGVWRFKPPFGSLQLAYQRGTSEFGEPSEQGDTLFTKLSWVF
ncbi:MAG: carbohydrate binding family 9 domain-containing protein [Acidobacteria bacterium]|nr:carbohydrate binding family 9 domain-containing protein [Candidatus Sulfomarinibacter sp. MAG AM1]